MHSQYPYSDIPHFRVVVYSFTHILHTTHIGVCYVDNPPTVRSSADLPFLPPSSSSAPLPSFLPSCSLRLLPSFFHHLSDSHRHICICPSRHAQRSRSQDHQQCQWHRPSNAIWSRSTSCSASYCTPKNLLRIKIICAILWVVWVTVLALKAVWAARSTRSRATHRTPGPVSGWAIGCESPSRFFDILEVVALPWEWATCVVLQPCVMVALDMMGAYMHIY